MSGLRHYKRLTLGGVLLTAAALTVTTALAIGPSTIGQIRAYDATHGGFNWTPWSAVPDYTKTYIEKRAPDVFHDISGDEKNVDIAIKDLDFDHKNDVIVYMHGPIYCGSVGCVFYVVPGEIQKQIFSFSAHQVKPMRRGILADGNPNTF